VTDITVEVVAAPAIEVTVTQAGAPGMSAYQHAVANGFAGTEVEWLASLQGEDGEDGSNGVDGTRIYTDSGAPVITGAAGDIYIDVATGNFYTWSD
jgi:hypothetical protein